MTIIATNWLSELFKPGNWFGALGNLFGAGSSDPTQRQMAPFSMAQNPLFSEAPGVNNIASIIPFLLLTQNEQNNQNSLMLMLMLMGGIQFPVTNSQPSTLLQTTPISNVNSYNAITAIPIPPPQIPNSLTQEETAAAGNPGYSPDGIHWYQTENPREIYSLYQAGSLPWQQVQYY